MSPGADLRWGRGSRAPRFIYCPPDLSNMIFEVPKCFKMQISRGSAPDPAEESSMLPRLPSRLGRGYTLAIPLPLDASMPSASRCRRRFRRFD